MINDSRNYLAKYGHLGSTIWVRPLGRGDYPTLDNRPRVRQHKALGVGQYCLHVINGLRTDWRQRAHPRILWWWWAGPGPPAPSAARARLPPYTGTKWDGEGRCGRGRGPAPARSTPVPVPCAHGNRPKPSWPLAAHSKGLITTVNGLLYPFQRSRVAERVAAWPARGLWTT